MYKPLAFLAAMLLLSACKKENEPPKTTPVKYCSTQCKYRYPMFVFPADEYSPEDLDSVVFKTFGALEDTLITRFTIHDTSHYIDEDGRLLYGYGIVSPVTDVIIPATNQHYKCRVLNYPDIDSQYICKTKPPYCVIGISDILVDGGNYSVSKNINEENYIYLKK